MESYIVRIYRRDAGDPRKLVGITEVIETQEKKAFHSFDELLPILCPANVERNKTGPKRKERQQYS